MIKLVAKEIEHLVETIEQDNFDTSAKSIEDKVGELWFLMESLRSDFVFEAIDAFRMVHNSYLLSHKPDQIAQTLITFHQLLARQMVESHHREYLFKHKFGRV